MARPIIPVAVRRESDGSPAEVQSAGGVWFPITNMDEDRKKKLWKQITDAGYEFPLPKTAFHWPLARVNNGEPTTPDVQPEPRDSQPQPEPQPEPQPVDAPDMPPAPDQPRSPQPAPSPNKDNDDMTVEDIIRRIATEVASTLDESLSAALINEINARVADLQPIKSPDVPLRDVITTITINRPDVAPIDMKGIFHREMPALMFNILNGIHTYLPGPPGSGKTHSALQCIRELGGKAATISFGPTTPESRLTGGMTANGEFFEPALLKLIRSAMENPDVIHAMILDEMDNGHGGIQATLNSLLANGEMTAPNGDHLVVGKNMLFIACANTYGTGPTAEFAGRNKLDAATLDRFEYIPWDTDEAVETALVHAVIGDSTVANAWLDVWRTTRHNAKEHGLKVFVTMRGAVEGARAVAAGRDIQSALMYRLGYKVPADQWAKMNPL